MHCETEPDFAKFYERNTAFHREGNARDHTRYVALPPKGLKVLARKGHVQTATKFADGLVVRCLPEDAGNIDPDASPIQNTGEASWYFVSGRSHASPARDFIPRADPEVVFRRHVEKWRKETKFLSSIHDITANPSYKKIIDIGSAAIPLILKDLEQNGGSWFFALKRLTAKDPVKAEDRGYVNKMKEAWIGWGRQNHYI
jgi:hypothetical protein